MQNNIQNIVSDILVITRRNLIRYIRLPQLLVFSTIQPVMFVLLFVYVFGGAIKNTGVSYVNYLIPGILVQTVIFGAMQTGIGLADDISKGMIDRFNSLPIARFTVLSGRILSDTLRNIFVVLLMCVVGFIIGFRYQTSLLEFVFALFIVILFGFSFSWVSAIIGLVVKDPETAQVGGFVWIFPLVFASSIFVPIDTMPSLLKFFAKNSPITIVVNAVRGLILGGGASSNILNSFIWVLSIFALFAPLAVYLYNRETK